MQELLTDIKAGDIGVDFSFSEGPGSKFDCRKCLDRCKGECCGPCPIPADTWQRRQADVQGDIVHALADDEGFVHVVRTDGYCAFKRADGTCAIYPLPGQRDERADVCKRFGDESHVMLTCRWMDREGRIRPRFERREISRAIGKATQKFLRRMKRNNSG